MLVLLCPVVIAVSVSRGLSFRSGVSEKEILSGIEYLNEGTFATCSRGGDVRMFDKRQSGDKHTLIPAPNATQLPCVFAVAPGQLTDC